MPISHSSIDEQVVKMSFDNSNFDSNINDSIKTLNSLDNKLGVLNKTDFSGITNSINNLANVFTTKGQIMLGVFTRLGSKIVNLSRRALNKLTKGIKDGLGEYNQIIESTQTIYQNVKQSGATIKDVNEALDELNDYADKTIYNFGEMTRMIGMFTSAGVGLGKSVNTIKGLANAAALVGANTQKAQVAWNAVSRAMSSGTFSNITWRSLELSGIAGKQFNDVITEVARANNVIGKSGLTIDKMIKKYGTLRESLREKWLTKDLFAEAMSILSGDLSREQLQQKGYTEKQIDNLLAIAEAAEEAATQVKTFKQLLETTSEAIGSGWAQSFRILIGDLDEAKKIYTRISYVVSGFIDNNARIRNELFKQIVDGQDEGILKNWKTGRQNFQQIIENMLATVKTFLKSVKTGFLNIFPIERISEAARKVLDVVQNFTRAFVINNEQLNKDGLVRWDTENIDNVSEAIKDLIRFFRGLASAVDVAWMAFSQPLKVIIDRIPFLKNFFENTNSGIIGLLKNLGKFGDKITVFRDAIKETNFFGTALEIFLDNIDELGERHPVFGAILSVFRGLRNALDNAKEGFKRLNIEPLSVLFGAFKFTITALGKALDFVFNILRVARNSIDWSFLEGPKNAIITFIKKLSDYGKGLISFEELIGKIGKSISNVVNKIINAFNKLIKNKNLKTAYGEIEKSNSNLIGVVDKTGKKITSIWNKVTGFFAPIGEFFKTVFNNADWTFENISKKIALIGGGVAAATLSISHLVKTLKKIKILDNINDILLAGLDVVKAYQREMQSKMILNIAIAIGILATSLAILSFIPYERLENGLVIFSTFMATLALTLPPIITAMAKFNRSIKYTRQEIRQLTKYDVLNNALNNLIGTLGHFGSEMAAALNKKMIGQMLKDIAFSIFILVGAIAALVLLIKLDGEVVKQAIHYFGVIVVTLTVAVLGLTIAVNLFSKTAKNTKASIGTFSSFFKLSGVAAVILSIAAAIAILVAALSVMTRLNKDRLEECFYLIMSLTALMGIISVGTAAAASTAKNVNTIKKITVSFAGAMAGIAVVLLAMKPLIEVIQKDTSGGWWKAIVLFTSIISQFTIMATLLLFTAKKVGGQTTIWEKLNKALMIMTVTVAAVGGVLYAISKMGDIPTSAVTTIGILTIAMLGIISLLSLIAIVISRAKTTFSSNFVKVIEGISFSIAAVIAAIGVMTAGVAALIASLSTVDVSNADTTAASDSLINKLKAISDTIRKSLPALRKVFYSIGRYIGSVFVTFIAGFTDSVVETAETYNEVAEKLVNLIVDIIGKVTTIIHNRKDDIKRIIRNIVDVIGGLITEVLNDVFKKDSSNKFTEDQVLKFLGFTGVTVGGGAAILKLASNFNTLAQSVERLKKIGIKWNTNWSIGTNLHKINENLVRTISNLGLIKSLGNSAAGVLNNTLKKVTGKSYTYNANAETSIPETIAAIGAVAVAVKFVEAAVHGVRQQIGEELPYIRSDLELNYASNKRTKEFWEDAFTILGAMLEDRLLAIQVLVEGGTKLGEGIWTLIFGLFRSIQSVVGAIVSGIAGLGIIFMNGIDLILGFIQEKILMQKGAYTNAVDRKNESWAYWKNFFDTTVANPFTENLNAAVRLFNDNETYQKVYDGAKTTMNYATQGAIDGSETYRDVVGEKISKDTEYIMGEMADAAGVHSPSTITREIYHNVMLGCIEGLKLGEKELEKKTKELIERENELFSNGAKEASGYFAEQAWADISSASGFGKPIRNLNATVVDTRHKDANGNVYKQEVALNREMVDLIKDQADALEGKNREEARNILLTKMRSIGMKSDAESIEQMQIALEAFYTNSEDHDRLRAENIRKFAESTVLSVMDVAGASAAATETVIQDTYGRYFDLMSIAEQHKDELVGKKKEEVEEILKQEAIKAGLTAAEAEDSAKLAAGQMFAGMKAEETITKQRLKNTLDAYTKDFLNYEYTQKKKTELLEEYAANRSKIVETQAWIQSQYESGAWSKTGGDYLAWLGTAEGQAFDKLLKQQNKVVNDYKNAVNGQKAAIEKMYTDAGMSSENAAKKFASDYDRALNTINSANAKKNGLSSIQGLISGLGKLLGRTAKDVDLSFWNWDDKKDSPNLPNTDTKTAIDAAKELKGDLEAQRADLTPTFDLDQLASDANKANGIVMSSLMAAQNASIGDYINKDSELNPFMKDRWQNVYNFTQNNYSPKALSRIDIYRQTQRQISMSRGF